jgi:hypothetical protein
MSDYHDAEIALLIAIPTDITVNASGQPLDEDSIDAIRRMRAGDWARAGHADRGQVRAWLDAGVVDPWAARVAELRGYRPGDPWVPQGLGPHNVFGWDEQHAREEQPANWWARRTNRRRARERWHTAQLQAALDAPGRAEQPAPPTPAGYERYFAALHLAGGAGLEAHMLLEIVEEARLINALASEALSRCDNPQLLAAWLERETPARGLPNGDTVPLKYYTGTPQDWLTSEASQWLEYLAVLEQQLDKAHARLPLLVQLSDAERVAGEQLLDRSRDDCANARRSWGKLPQLVA